MEFLFVALAFGFGSGSLHCIGMCGPIVLALPVSSTSWTKKIIGIILYNFGRAITYAILGAIFGLFGKGLNIAGLQQIVSIVLGAMMIASVLIPFVYKQNKKLNRIIHGYSGKITKQFGKYFRSSKLISLLIIGLLNGLLPCGLVYIALAGSIATGSVLNGSLFMIAFGIGTMPALILFSVFSSSVSFKIKSWINKALPFLIVLVGLLFILRGSGLGIKYISPPNKALEIQEPTDSTSHHCCH